MTGPSFTRREYRLLESVVELRLPLSILTSPTLGEKLNKTAHGLSAVSSSAGPKTTSC